MWWLRINNESTLSFKEYKEAAYHTIKEIENNPDKKIIIEIIETK